jgi:hypothetical protein
MDVEHLQHLMKHDTAARRKYRRLQECRDYRGEAEFQHAYQQDPAVVEAACAAEEKVAASAAEAAKQKAAAVSKLPLRPAPTTSPR